MKITAILLLLGCLSPGVLAEDLATPSPTPVYTHPLARRGALRRAQQIDRRRAREAATEEHAQARAKAKTNHRSGATALTQASEAARTREQAEREVAAQNRIEAARATPHATSDVMSRMGFSEKEIAAQKAREQSAQIRAKDSSSANSKNASAQKPVSASPAAADSDSR